MKFFNVKTLVLAFLVSFAFCFFISIFANSQIRNKNGQYYINRGYPVAWSGVILTKLKVELPIVKAPFVVIKESSGNYNKIIDLQIFIPMFLAVFMPNYLLNYIFVRATKENSKLMPFLNVYLGILLFSCIFFYFFWFPRI